MKNIFYILILSILFSACCLSKQAMKRGEYAQATALSTEKVLKRKSNSKEVIILEQAFSIANKKDLEEITFLKNQNMPSNAERIFNLYQQIRNRQERIKPILPLYIKKQKRQANFSFTNVDNELIASKNLTADFYYKKGKFLLEKNNRFDAREAYTMFEHTMKFNSDYKDIQQLKEQAYIDGQNYVFVKMINESQVMLPEDFERNLLSITTNDLKTFWTTYDTKRRNNVNYTHSIIIRLKNIDVSPEREFNREYTEEKEMQETIVEKDKNDKPLKDTLGNEITHVKKYKIRCKVFEFEQNKSALVSGLVEFYDKETKEILKRLPVTSTMVWQNFALKAKGDERALCEATKQKLGGQPLPFPNNLFILSGAGEKLKPQVKDMIANYFLLVK